MICLIYLGKYMDFTHPYRLTKHVKLLQKAALWHQGSVLLLKRPDDDSSRPGKWDLPGGNSEWPVSVYQNQANIHALDIAREIVEETGIVISQAQLAEVQPQLISTFFEPKKQLFSIIVGWRIELPDTFDRTGVLLSEEHTAFNWVKAVEAQQFDFGFAGGADGFIAKILSL